MEPSQATLDGVAWFVQVSDIHLGAYDAQPDYFRRYGDKAGDLRCIAPSHRPWFSPYNMPGGA